MRLEQKVATRNNKYRNHTSGAIPLDNMPLKSSGVELALSVGLGDSDSEGDQRNDRIDIASNNVLVFGENQDWNHELASLIQRDFFHTAKLSKIITSHDFLSMDAAKMRDPKITYIVICADLDIASSDLKKIKELVSTLCIFKIPGLEWQRWEFDRFDITPQAQKILNALSIKDELMKGLLTSLNDRAFCVFTGKSFYRRSL